MVSAAPRRHAVRALRESRADMGVGVGRAAIIRSGAGPVAAEAGPVRICVPSDRAGFGATRIANGLGYSEDVLINGDLVWKPWCHYPVGYSGFLGVIYKAFGSSIGDPAMVAMARP